MDVREKLVELLNDSFDEQYSKRGLLTAPHTATDLIANGVTIAAEIEELKADNDRLRDMWARTVSELSKEKASGVTVQQWIPVTERLPEPETNVIAFVGDYIDILAYRYDLRGNLAFMYMDDSGWWHKRIRPSVTNWMPLPEPPKEDE